MKTKRLARIDGMAKWGFALATMIVMMSPAMAEIIPAARRTLWQPGVTYNGGIPNRTTIYKTLSPSGGDDTAAIQTALDDCPANQVVQLTAGTFQITSLTIQTSSITLRGAGPSLTKLIKDGPFTGISIGGLQFSDQITVVSNAPKGTNQVTLSGPPPSGVPLRVGEVVFIDHVTNSLSWWNPAPNRSPGGGPSVDESRGWYSEYDRPIGQTMEIAAINGNTLTFTTPFHTDFMVADQTRLARNWRGDKVQPVTTPIQWVSIEDLYVAGSEDEARNGNGNFSFGGAKYCWMKNIESDKNLDPAVGMKGAFRCELRDSYIHSTVRPTYGGGGYGIDISVYSSDNLVENCISWNFNKVIVMRASGGGNVIGYNYMQDAWGSNYPDMNESGINASHYTTPHYELFEGNESFSFSGDSTWGNSVYITVFRNSLTTRRTAAPPVNAATYSFVDGTGETRTQYYEDHTNRNAISVGSFHRYYNFVGNVLGTSDMTLLTNPKSTYPKPQTAFVLNADGVSGHVPMWDLGTGEDDYIVPDPQLKPSFLFHGNYDYVTNAIQWDAATSDHALPDSLYIPAGQRPPFFAGLTWPWVTPENAPATTATLPAKVRFNTIHNIGGPADTLAPARPRGLRKR